MKATELRDKTVEELDSELLTQLETQFKFRLQSKTGQLNQPHWLKEAHRDIARIKTVLREKAGNYWLMHLLLKGPIKKGKHER